MVIKNNKNYYEILGVTPDVEIVELKVVYRRLVRKYHPDINQGSENLFKEVTEAYETLSDAQLRKQYDMINGFFKSTKYKTNDLGASKTPKADKSAKTSEEQVKKETFKDTFHEKTVNVDKKAASEQKVNEAPSPESVKFENFKPKHKKYFSIFFNDIMDGISGITKKTAPKMPEAKKGEDIYTDITISVKDAVMGTHRIVNVMHTEVCPNCHGRKFINGAKCTMCDGKGELSKHQKINVTIPSHVKNGSKLRIAGEGNRGYNGGKDGDLYLKITIAPNSSFKFDGLDILCEVPITPFEAALGGEIKVPALEGEVVLKLPASTQSGQIFRLSSRGMKKNNKIGDIIITVRIQIPKKLSAEETELYRKLKNVSVENVRENLLND